jgi:iron complex transport system permease protein
VAVLVVYRLSLRKGALSLYTLLLVGVMLNSLFISTIIFLQSLVRSDELVTVLFWLLGSLTFTNYTRLLIVAVILASCAIPLILNARKMNLLSMGESTAQALGVDIEKTKRSIFFLAALLTAMAVSVSGIIGFVGLVVPHLTRSLLGSDYRKTLPACVLLGGGVLLWSDILARMLIRPQELPVGVITSFLGVPFFIYFMKRKESKRIL